MLPPEPVGPELVPGPLPTSEEAGGSVSVTVTAEIVVVKYTVTIEV